MPAMPACSHEQLHSIMSDADALSMADMHLWPTSLQ